MAYFQILKDLGMNYTLNRPLLDGTATARIKTAKALAATIVDFHIWYRAWLDVAKQSEADGRCPNIRTRDGRAGELRAHHQGSISNRLSSRFRLRAVGEELATFVFNGGYDSFVEEFYPFLKPLTEIGYTVIGFDGPGQGGAIRQGLRFTHAWERPAKAPLDYFRLCRFRIARHGGPAIGRYGKSGRPARLRAARAISSMVEFGGRLSADRSADHRPDLDACDQPGSLRRVPA